MAWTKITRVAGCTTYTCGCGARSDTECRCDEDEEGEYQPPTEVTLPSHPDQLARKMIGVSFATFVAMGDGRYVPTFCGDQAGRAERKALADAFDAARQAAGGPVSHRCHW